MLLIASFLLAAGTAAVPAAPPVPSPAGPPKMVIEPTVFDAGKLPRGTPASAVFQVRNVGGEVLRLLSVRPG